MMPGADEQLDATLRWFAHLHKVTTMPSKSAKQARLMAAAAHTPGGYGGVPQSVGKEFNQADTGTGILKRKPRKARKPAMKTYLVK